MEKFCPRCGSAFDCCHDDIQQCWCAREKLPDTLRDTLSGNYDACLCLSCVSELRNDNKSNVNQTL